MFHVSRVKPDDTVDKTRLFSMVLSVIYFLPLSVLFPAMIYY